MKMPRTPLPASGPQREVVPVPQGRNPRPGRRSVTPPPMPPPPGRQPPRPSVPRMPLPPGPPRAR